MEVLVFSMVDMRRAKASATRLPAPPGSSLAVVSSKSSGSTPGTKTRTGVTEPDQNRNSERTGPEPDQNSERTGPEPDQNRNRSSERTGPDQDQNWTRTLRGPDFQDASVFLKNDGQR